MSGIVAWPGALIPQAAEWTINDGSPFYQSPTVSVVRSSALLNTRFWSTRLEFKNMKGAPRLAAIGFTIGLRGRSGRVYLTDTTARRFGSFPTLELLPNGQFSAGLSGWSTSGNYSLAIVDGAIRASRTGVAGSTIALQSSATVGVTANVPYAARFIVLRGRGDRPIGFAVRAGSTVGGSDYLLDAASSGYGLKTFAFVPSGSSAAISLLDMQPSAIGVGDYIVVPYVSLARCALADAGVNLLTFSDGFNQWGVTRGSVSIDTGSVADPNGTNGGDILVEDATASSTHSVQQTVTVPAAVGDYCFTVAIRAAARGFAQLVMQESAGASSISAYFDLSGSGAVGTTAIGTFWSNIRTAIRPLGNNWYQCTLIGKKGSSATTITAQIVSAIGSTAGSSSYTGTSVGALVLWRGTLAPSSVPVRLPSASTGAVANPSGTQGGLGIYLKGLPLSANGILSTLDPIEVNGEYKRVLSSLNSDEQGCGYLEVDPPVRQLLPDNAPIVINDPLCRMFNPNPQLSWETRPGEISDFVYDLIEDVREVA